MKSKNTIPLSELKFTRISEAEQLEENYQRDLNSFTENHQNADEDFYLNERIKILNDVMAEWYPNIDFYAKTESEIIHDTFNADRLGGAADYINFSNELKFLQQKKEALLNPIVKEVPALSNNNQNNDHPKHDPNLWNVECYELFMYLYDNYYKRSKRQITNIWFYLKEYENKKYILSATKDLYREFIIGNYSIELTNFDKAQQKWEDKEYNKLDEHRQDFEDGLK